MKQSVSPGAFVAVGVTNPFLLFPPEDSPAQQRRQTPHPPPFVPQILIAQWWVFSKDSKTTAAEKGTVCAIFGAAAGLALASAAAVHAFQIPLLVAGKTLGWISAVIFTAARLPQIWKIATTHSVAQLSPWMFVLLWVSNITYVLSILSVSLEAAWIAKQLPFLAAVAGPIALDTVLLLQILYYRTRPQPPNPLVFGTFC